MTVAASSVDTKILYSRLCRIGFNRPFVRSNGLPEWWTDECDALPDAPATIAAYLSRRFNLDFDWLLNPDLAEQERILPFKKSGRIHYKTTNKQDVPSEPDVASSMARRVAELVAFSSTTDYEPIEGMTSYGIRESILKQGKVVTLESLLGFCQAKGVPVIHFANFPKKAKRFQGMVTRCGHRPVVVLALQDLSPSRLAFILAHELGHIALEHLHENEAISDEVIKPDAQNDQQESSANGFATELILGRPDNFYCFHENMNPGYLTKLADQRAKWDKVDPGAIAWNYAWQGGKWGVARKAINCIEQDANAPLLINQELHPQLDPNRLSEDNQDYLILALKLDEYD